MKQSFFYHLTTTLLPPPAAFSFTKAHMTLLDAPGHTDAEQDNLLAARHFIAIDAQRTALAREPYDLLERIAFAGVQAAADIGLTVASERDPRGYEAVHKGLAARQLLEEKHGEKYVTALYASFHLQMAIDDLSRNAPNRS